jgi:hypothetical protein
LEERLVSEDLSDDATLLGEETMLHECMGTSLALSSVFIGFDLLSVTHHCARSTSDEVFGGLCVAYCRVSI